MVEGIGEEGELLESFEGCKEGGDCFGFLGIGEANRKDLGANMAQSHKPPLLTAAKLLYPLKLWA